MNDNNFNPSPCYKCDKRHAGCHASCEAYGAWSAKRETERSKRRKFDDAKDFQIKGIRKVIRNKERRTPR